MHNRIAPTKAHRSRSVELGPTILEVVSPPTVLGFCSVSFGFPMAYADSDMDIVSSPPCTSLRGRLHHASESERDRVPFRPPRRSQHQDYMPRFSWTEYLDWAPRRNTNPTPKQLDPKLYIGPLHRFRPCLIELDQEGGTDGYPLLPHTHTRTHTHTHTPSRAFKLNFTTCLVLDFACLQM